MTQRYIISGGPGSGKSTLIEGLRAGGYSCSEEVSRRLIRQETALDSDCLPWADIRCFSFKVLAEMIADWHRFSAEKLVFFDRAIPDIIAYLKFAGQIVDPVFYSKLKTHPYADKVYILPAWEEIYVNDPERWQTFEESKAISILIEETYIDLGYELIRVPCVPVAQRIAFIFP